MANHDRRRLRTWHLEVERKTESLWNIPRQMTAREHWESRQNRRVSSVTIRLLGIQPIQAAVGSFFASSLPRTARARWPEHRETSLNGSNQIHKSYKETWCYRKPPLHTKEANLKQTGKLWKRLFKLCQGIISFRSNTPPISVLKS